MIIHLNGMHGVGKFTTARALASRLNARLIDNHLLIDLTTALCKRGSTEYFSILKKITGIVLEQIAERRDENFIFTNALAAELGEDRERLDNLTRFSNDRDIPFLQVLLLCDLEENKRRIISEERKLKGKLMDPSELEEVCRNYSIYHPPAKYLLKIDTTWLSPEEASEQIAKFAADIEGI